MEILSLKLNDILMILYGFYGRSQCRRSQCGSEQWCDL